MNTEETGRKGKILIFIAALFGSLLLWMYAIGYDTEIDEQIFSGIPVEIHGMHDNGYTVAEEASFSLTIDVHASGTRAALNAADAGEFRAYVDISKVNEPGYATLPITVVPPNGLTAGNLSVSNVTLYIDRFTSKNINIQIEKTYFSEYEIGNTLQSLYTVEVSGPESVIGTAEAYCSFALGNITGDTVHVSGEIRLRNAETKADISNPYITLKDSTVDVTFVLYGSKTVPVELVLAGGKFRPEDVRFLISVSGVELHGPISELDLVSSLTILCDEEQFEGNRLTASLRADELLRQNFPESALSATDAEISYTVILPEVLYRTVLVPLERISVYNLPEEAMVQASVMEPVEVTLFGPADAIQSYDESLMTIRVDFQTLEPQLSGDEFYGAAEIDTGSSAVCVDGSTYVVPVRLTSA